MGKWASKQRRSSSRKSRAYSSVHEDDHRDTQVNPVPSGRGGPKHAPFQNPDSVMCVDTSVGHFCLSGSIDGTVLLQDISSKVKIHENLVHTKEVTKVKCGSELCMSASRDKTIKIWNHEAEKGQLVGHSLSVTAIDCDDQFSQMWSGSRDNAVRLWDVESLSCVQESKISRNLVTDLSLSTELNLIVQTSEDRIVKLWDPRNLELVHSFPIQGQIQTSCAVLQNFCATTNNGFSSQGCEVCVWDLRERRLLQILKGHTETATSCKFIGSNLVSCSHDGTVRLWRYDHGSYGNASILHLDSGTLTSLSPVSDEKLVCCSFDRGMLMINAKQNELTL